MEKRILLAFILSFGVLYAFRWVFPPPPDPPATAPASQTTSSGADKPTPAAPAPEPPVSRPTTPVPTDIHGERPAEIVVDNALITATLSNVGGILTSYKVKAYPDAEGKPTELVNRTVSAQVGWPLAITTGDAAVDALLAKASFQWKQAPENSVTMEFAAEGVHARKSIQFDPTNYEFSVRTELSRDGKELDHRILWQGGFGDQSIPSDEMHRNAVLDAGEKFERIAVAKIEPQTQRVTARVGVEDQYFLSMFVFGEAVSAHIARSESTGEDGEITGNVAVAVPAQRGTATRVYVGPKDRTWLRKSDPKTASVVDYGMFWFITEPLILALLWIHNYIGNFGWAIIILTLVINLLLFPLRLKQQVSMQKLQKLQPQMRTLQDKLKKLKVNDPRRAEVQADMMNLYKVNGVSPMGGCVPLLLQLPFLFGFYNALSVSIELRGAPWILWIRDLSQYDPYYVMPILMAGSMMVMQKLTPQTMDPAQARIMMLMPLILTVMFLWAQSGLMLYWLTSNVVGAAQQLLVMKYWTPADDSKHPNTGKARSR